MDWHMLFSIGKCLVRHIDMLSLIFAEKVLITTVEKETWKWSFIESSHTMYRGIKKAYQDDGKKETIVNREKRETTTVKLYKILIGPNINCPHLNYCVQALNLFLKKDSFWKEFNAG